MGLVKSWVLNIGPGSYMETKFDAQNEDSVYKQYGFQAGLDHIRVEPIGWQPKEKSSIIECSADSTEVPIQAEFGTD